MADPVARFRSLSKPLRSFAEKFLRAGCEGRDKIATELGLTIEDLQDPLLKEYLSMRIARGVARAGLDADGVIEHLGFVIKASAETFLETVDGKTQIRDVLDMDRGTLSAVKRLEIHPNGMIAVELHDKVDAARLYSTWVKRMPVAEPKAAPAAPEAAKPAGETISFEERRRRKAATGWRGA